jgi:hypothetical protein
MKKKEKSRKEKKVSNKKSRAIREMRKQQNEIPR